MNVSGKTRVAVLRGGPSSEYEVSLKTGGQVLATLREMPETYEPLDVFISKNGEWHLGGLVQEPHEVLKRTDVAFNALHGHYGEDGQVQRILESLQIPYTGSSAISSALAMNKDMAKQIYLRHSLLTPRHEVVGDGFGRDQLIYIFQNYLHPVVVKPATGGSSIGQFIARTFKELEHSIKKALTYSKKVLVEEMIKGTDVSCAVLEGGKGENLYAFVPVGRTNAKENKRITEMAKLAHETLGLRHYSSSDFVITSRGNIYILETDALPSFHEDSALHQSLGATGWRSRDFVDHVIRLAR
jgi:D-alanine-D-alanine ligase